MEDDCQTVSEEEEEESQEEEEEESVSELEPESSQSTGSEMDQISMCEQPSPSISHMDRQIETCSTTKLWDLPSLGLFTTFAMSKISRFYQAICVEF